MYVHPERLGHINTPAITESRQQYAKNLIALPASSARAPSVMSGLTNLIQPAAPASFIGHLCEE